MNSLWVFLYVAAISKPLFLIEAAFTAGSPPKLPRYQAIGRFTRTSSDNELYYSVVKDSIECIQNIIVNAVHFSFFQKRNQFYNISLDLMFVANLRGEIVDLNPQVEFFLGIPKIEVISQSILNFLHPYDITKTIQALSDLKKNKVLKGFSTKVLSHTKNYKNIQWNAISDEQYMYVVGRDLTDDENVKNELIKVNTWSFSP